MYINRLNTMCRFAVSLVDKNDYPLLILSGFNVTENTLEINAIVDQNIKTRIENLRTVINQIKSVIKNNTESDNILCYIDSKFNTAKKLMEFMGFKKATTFDKFYTKEKDNSIDLYRINREEL